MSISPMIQQVIKDPLPNIKDGYPVAYLTKSCKQLCPTCANKEIVVNYKLLWYDGSFERCDICNRSLK